MILGDVEESVEFQEKPPPDPRLEKLLVTLRCFLFLLLVTCNASVKTTAPQTLAKPGELLKGGLTDCFLELIPPPLRGLFPGYKVLSLVFTTTQTQTQTQC